MYYGLYFSCKFSATDSLSFLLIGIVIILVKAFSYSCKSFTFSADRYYHEFLICNISKKSKK